MLQSGDKAPSEETGFRKHRQIPLLRTNRVAKLEERVRATDLPRALTQRGVVPQPKETAVSNQPADLIEDEIEALDLETTIQAMSINIESHPAEAERAPQYEPEDENIEPRDTSSSPRTEIAPSDTVESEFRIPLNPDLMKPDSEEDEFIERSQEFPDEGGSSSETKAPQEGVQKRVRPKFTHRTGLSKINPTTSQDLAETIKYLIKVEPSPEVGTVRAMNALYSAAGGHVPFDPKQPETRIYPDKLHNVPIEKRYEYLKSFFDQLELYLPPAERKAMRNSLAQLYSDTHIIRSDSSITAALISIRERLEKQLADLLE